MKKYLLMFILLLPALSAADDRHEQAMQRVQENIAAATERLQLSDDQVEKLRPILVDDAEKRIAIVRQYAIDENGERIRPSGKDARAFRSGIKVVNEQTNKALAGVLSVEQLEEYRQLQSERRAAMMEQRKKNGTR